MRDKRAKFGEFGQTGNNCAGCTEMFKYPRNSEALSFRAGDWSNMGGIGGARSGWSGGSSGEKGLQTGSLEFSLLLGSTDAERDNFDVVMKPSFNLGCRFCEMSLKSISE